MCRSPYDEQEKGDLMSGKIVVFGAGATGRGHVGLLAWQAGFEIVWVDKDAELVAALRKQQRYTVHFTGRGAVPDVTVTGFRVYFHEEREAIAREIGDADLVLTSVIEHNLPDVAKTLALGVAHCRRAGRQTPLNCIACENMPDSSSSLGRYVRALLSGDDSEYLDRFWGFPDCMISRVVPRPEPDPLRIVTENYNEWTVRAEAFRGEKPVALTAMELINNQTARLERKLFVHNGGHAICAYLAWHRGHEFIHQAVADPAVVEPLLKALDEIGAVVLRKHPCFSEEEIAAYKRELGERGANEAMRDPIARVVRDPIRKLGPQDRLLGPAQLAVEYGLPRAHIVQGIVAALRYHSEADSQSVQLARDIAERGLPAVLEDVCGLAKGSPLVGEILSAWDRFQENRVAH
jgi:mannitol-1-phosphate 5-dehydrogenase